MPAKSQAITTATANLTTQSAGFASAATKVTTLVTQASVYASTATSAALGSVPNYSTTNLLADVQAATAAVIAAIAADEDADDSATTYPAISAAEQVYDACNQLEAAVRSMRPVLFAYTVQAKLDLSVILATFYGKDAMARMDEILTLNRIPNPYAIPAGTVLQLPTPTV